MTDPVSPRAGSWPVGELPLDQLVATVSALRAVGVTRFEYGSVQKRLAIVTGMRAVSAPNAAKLIP